jgi:hypothetical protein
MISPSSYRTVWLFREFVYSATAPVDLRVRGHCMSPLLASGAVVRVAARRFYWPGDLVVVLAPDGRLLAHRLLGWYWKQGSRWWLTQADSAPGPDPAIPLTHFVGKVVGGDSHPHAFHVPLRHRLWACGRFLQHALRAVRRRC